MSLEDVARPAGFTRSLLSKIETGRSSPPMATAARIAQALRVPLAALFADGDAGRRVELTRADDATPMPSDKGYRSAALAAGRAEKAMQPFVFTARRGEVRRKALSHPGEEFVYVLAGRLRYRVGAVEYALGPGDSLYFDSHEEHDVAVASASATWLAVFLERPAAPARRKP